MSWSSSSLGRIVVGFVRSTVDVLRVELGRDGEEVEEDTDNDEEEDDDAEEDEDDGEEDKEDEVRGISVSFVSSFSSPTLVFFLDRSS